LSGIYTRGKQMLEAEQKTQQKQQLLPTNELRSTLQAIIKASEQAISKIDPLLQEKERLLELRESRVLSDEAFRLRVSKSDQALIEVSAGVSVLLGEVQSAVAKLEALANLKVGNLELERDTLNKINSALTGR